MPKTSTETSNAKLNKNIVFMFLYQNFISITEIINKRINPNTNLIICFLAHKSKLASAAEYRAIKPIIAMTDTIKIKNQL